jgi:hypothetical protein
MARSICTRFVVVGVLELLSGPTIGPALNDLARETTPFLHQHNKNLKAPSEDESRGSR